ncbi:hypothetical protein BGX31_010657 [Mortierella sp. GBA43]|nr:hypothetical protein BGX31_010657 [Mortierella sp. GBA43]
MEFVLPRVRELRFDANYGLPFPEIWKLQDILDRCSSVLKVLRKHFSTLTELSVSGCSGDIGGSFVQALASGPSLHTMATFNVSDYEGVYPRIDAKAFIDRNPINGSFQTWQCETSLRVLMIKINGIPRPDLQGRTIREIYQGQGREIQGQVYDRLARLTNLETLWLGHLSSNMLSSALVEADKVSCLELSLESGLWRLGSLKSLKELSVSRMKTRIGVKEVQWMVEHWPKLRVIHGLDNTGDAKKAAVWLRENHPGVRLR